MERKAPSNLTKLAGETRGNKAALLYYLVLQPQSVRQMSPLSPQMESKSPNWRVLFRQNSGYAVCSRQL